MTTHLAIWGRYRRGYLGVLFSKNISKPDVGLRDTYAVTAVAEHEEIFAVPFPWQRNNDHLMGWSGRKTLAHDADARLLVPRTADIGTNDRVLKA